MSDASYQQHKPHRIKPLKQSDSSLSSAWQCLAERSWEQRLPGSLTLAEGLALLALFCFAPWFTWQGVNIAIGPASPALTRYFFATYGPHFYSGWTLAQSISIPTEPAFFFGYLWLILPIGLALLIFAVLHLRQRISARRTLAAFLALSVLVLLIVAALYLQARSFPKTLDGLDGPYSDNRLLGITPFIAS